MKDRDGKVIKTIYRSKKAMQPARENVSRAQENERRAKRLAGQQQQQANPAK